MVLQALLKGKCHPSVLFHFVMPSSCLISVIRNFVPFKFADPCGPAGVNRSDNWKQMHVLEAHLDEGAF
jgi:hypothetical protein